MGFFKAEDTQKKGFKLKDLISATNADVLGKVSETKIVERMIEMI